MDRKCVVCNESIPREPDRVCLSCQALIPIDERILRRDREAARDLSKRLERAQEEIASLKEDNQLLRRKIENHIIMSEDFKAEYESWLDSLNVEVK